MSENVSKAMVIQAAEKVTVIGIALAGFSFFLSQHRPVVSAAILAVAIGLACGAALTAVLGAGWHK